MHLLWSDYETCTDYVKRENEEIFLETFHFNDSFLRYIKKIFSKKLIYNTILDAFAIIFIYYYAFRCALNN